MNKLDLEQLAICRLDEALVLLNAGKFPGAYYLGGYAVECALKVCIAKQIKEFDFPDKKLANDSWTHDLDRLLSLSGLKESLEDASSNNESLAANWATAKDWNEKSRYKLQDENAAIELLNAISDAANGVFQWIKLYW